MKKYITLVTIILIIISYSSCKSKANTDSENKVDSSIDTGPSSLDQLKQTDLNQIGDLSLGMKTSAVIEILGEPAAKAKTEVWGADGWLHQDWEYKSKGISFNMSSESDTSAMEVFSISIIEPCSYKTSKSIGIGSTYAEVMTVYKNDIDKSSTDENVITIGSLYGGIIIEFKNDKAVSIFLGAAAE